MPPLVKHDLNLPDAPKSAALWRGMYTDGLRVGFWLTYDATIAHGSHEIIKKHGLGWAADPKIWVGPAKSAEKVIKALSAAYPRSYPLEQGMAVLTKALSRPEPFWAMYALPHLAAGKRQDLVSETWILTFPYDSMAASFLKKQGNAQWAGDLQAWVIHGDKETALDLLARMGAPKEVVRVIGGFDGEGEPDNAYEPALQGGWKPYFVGVSEDDVITERVKLEVGGAEKPAFSSSSADDAARRKEAEAAKALREQMIQRAFHEPLALLPVDEAIIQEITERCSLMPHQPDGVRHFLSKTSALNGDDMGLGKTRQTVAAASVLGGGKVVVCPASLKDNWSREIRAVIPEAMPFVFENGLPESQPEWLIVNYERLGTLLELLDESPLSGVRNGPGDCGRCNPFVGLPPDSGARRDPCARCGPSANLAQPGWHFTVAAFDEAHYLKEPGAQRTQHAFALATRATRKWLLTATPMLNKAEETWTLLRLSGHPAGQVDVPTFIEHFTRSKNERHGLGDRISEWMLRRMKEDTLTMAGKFHHEPLVSASEEQLHRYHTVMDDNETMIAIQKITIARQWLEEVKREPILEMLGDLQPDAKAIVFCNFEPTVEWFMEQLPKGSAVRLTGKESRKKRNKAVQAFQDNPECRWFVANIKAAGVGLNLTAATYVFFVSRPWTPADQEQAEDRAYRIGQNERVEVYIPIVPDTIDEQIRALILNKKKITEDVLMGAVTAEQRRSEDLASRAQAVASA